MSYFYIIEHNTTGIRYAGSRYAKGCHPSEFMKEHGYTTSSNIINSIISNEGISAFKIIEVTEVKDAHDYETKFLEKNDCARSDRWYNMHNNKFDNQVSFASDKMNSIMISKYGVTNAMHVDSIKKKQKKTEQETLIKKYGVKHNMQIPEVRAKLSKHRIENGLSTGKNNPCFGLKGKNHPASKAKKEKHKQILEFYMSKPNIKHGHISKNGKVLSYERAFANTYCNKFNLTNIALYGIITTSNWGPVQ
jgi:hypothetical protein